MKLSVPFIPNNEYAKFLTAQKQKLSSMYFPLPFGPSFDSRIRIGYFPQTDLATLVKALTPLHDIKKYILMNTRFVPPSLYTNTGELIQFLDKVAQVHHAVGIHGLVISDPYLVNALDRTGHSIIPLLEAIPGVNTMMDNMEKFQSWLELLDQTRFTLPGRIIIDRSLNRYPEKLRALYQQIKSYLPRTSIELLANEGCIFHCPFKPAHDAHIALSNTGLVQESTWTMNQTLGCHAYFNSHPHKILKSPFIRPEDLYHYQDMADTVKICGRTLGTDFLKKCIKAYGENSFQGNLLELMDATGFMAQNFNLRNPDLGSDFFKQITTCTKDCKPCRICSILFKKAASKKTAGLNSYNSHAQLGLPGNCANKT